jgi:hypothetical protein
MHIQQNVLKKINETFKMDLSADICKKFIYIIIIGKS